MAIATFSSSFKPLRGKVGGLVLKHYATKVVVTRAPTFSGQWSLAQQDGRKRFALASAHARAVCADPLLRAKYEKIAACRRLTVRSVVISAYLTGKTAGIETPQRSVRGPRLTGAKPHRGPSPFAGVMFPTSSFGYLSKKHPGELQFHLNRVLVGRVSHCVGRPRLPNYMLTAGRNAAAHPGEKTSDQHLISAPTLSLPKGGGAIRGMGEKFAANPVTGTGSMSIPIATSPGRSGFGPQLSLSYDSGVGNGVFGLGWNLSLPAITRKTDKGLPRYLDNEESDVFILSGAEDLVPSLTQQGGSWIEEPVPDRTLGTDTYRIKRYRPRIEGLFARIERWSHVTKLEEVFWRSISKDNISTWYGKTPASRIAEPNNPGRIFSWLICESRDDKGNAIVYEYAPENDLGVELDAAHETNRGASTGRRSANRYLKRIKYGNRVSHLVDPTLTNARWLFQVVLDYGESHVTEHAPDLAGNIFVDAEPIATANWPARQDPFSSYRSGFEVRTYRLCQRVLMFHHFDELVAENGADGYLVSSTEFHHRPGSAFTYLDSVTHSGFVWDKSAGRYLKRSLPPVAFTYSEVPTPAQLATAPIQELDRDCLENLPVGLDGNIYQWVDLNGEGISGVLTEQASAWYYKPNLGDGRLGAIQQVAEKPSFAGLHAGHQLLDLAGDGQLDVVDFGGNTPGFYERTPDERWENFKAFRQLPNLNWKDPNLRFVDLNGDGHADILITENEVFSWHPSLAEDGFAPAQKVHQPADEAEGPRLVFADGTQSVLLADMSGDGLTDLVRIRNGEVCYWPNLGYGKFGAMVTMDNSPCFDSPDIFDHRRIRTVDIDGSGATDILYLAADGVRIYYNQSGNRWSEAHLLPQLPAIDNYSTITTVDLFGNGTACLVWSSSLPAHARRPLCYIDLMGGQKPHLLVKTINNLGAETRVDYVSSTKFYLQDKVAGTPWITRLPFPVHCVEKVTITDAWRKTTFSNTYSYHHGYFDGIEREFRGFGRVERLDCESYDKFSSHNLASPYIADDQTLYQPPIKTVTWYHTGAPVDESRSLSQYEHEYFPRSFQDLHPDTTNRLDDFQENTLPDADLTAENLTAHEWRESLRACKGMVLRQEVYELDVKALTAGHHLPVKLFSTAYHNCSIRCLQRQAHNPHAVFLVAESEAITYNYELDLTQGVLKPDPRIAHTLNLRFDDYGNVLQSATIVYPRLGQFADATLSDDQLALIHQVQRERHLAYTETRYTDDFDLTDRDNYRLRVPCEILTYELTGIGPEDADDRASSDPRDNLYFSLDELRRYRLSPLYQSSGSAVAEIAYHELPEGTSPQKRLVEHARMLFFNDNLADPNALKKPLPLYKLGRCGLLFETYKLALTEELLAKIFATKLTAGIRSKLKDPSISGYLSGAQLDERFPGAGGTGQYWIRSGTAGFANVAAQHFYQPERYTDPFGNVTSLAYDLNDLFVKSSEDARGNTAQITRFDYRALSPAEMQDINGNHSEAAFDAFGRVVAVAIKGKKASIDPAIEAWEGDDLQGFDLARCNPPSSEIQAFCTSTTLDETKARDWLARATSRFIYHFGETRDLATNTITWAAQPAGACAIQRELHASSPGGDISPLQVVLECSDGGGNVLMKKAQAEPDPDLARTGPSTPLRWIVNGLIVLYNKGKPVKQYEPAFTPNFGCAPPEANGVTPVMFYDAAGRLVRTELPDGTFSRVEFSPWHVRTFDQNDTVLDSAWYADRNPPDPTQPLPLDLLTGRFTGSPDQRAAWLAAQHHNTPALTLLDSLGRDVVSIAHNRVKNDADELVDEKYLTFTKLDAEGKPLWIRDARGNLVMQYITPTVPNNQAEDPSENFAPCYDIAGNLLFQHSMDAGDRWILNDAAGKPMFAWDFNQRQDETNALIDEQRIYSTDYDELHRPTAQWLAVNSDAPRMIERFEYRDVKNNDGSLNTQLDADQAANLIGQPVRHYDTSGRIEVICLDFKGSPLEVQRRLVSDPTASVTDWQNNPTTKLEAETFVQLTEYDALKRMTRLYNWHRGFGSRVAVYEPRYNARSALASEQLVVQAIRNNASSGKRYDEVSGTTRRTDAIKEIRYDAKGQRQYLKLGCGTATRYDYDPLTFRLRQLRTTRPSSYDPQFPQYKSGLNDPKVLQQLAYTYDAVGNITEIYDDAYVPVCFQNQIVEPSCQYEYDALYRLTQASGRESGALKGAPTHLEDSLFAAQFPIQQNDPNAMRTYTQFFRYDPVGNIERLRHTAGPVGSWTRDYAYAFDDPAQPASNRLWQTWVGGDRTQAITYRHDPHGNMRNLANVAPGQFLRWDQRDMIASLDLVGGGWAHYQYDTGKQRTRKRLVQNGNIVEDRIYLGGFELYRRYNAADLTNPIEEVETLHLMDGQHRLLMVDQVIAGPHGASVLSRYILSNHLGSSTVELNENADIISYEEYHPYGTTAYQAVNKTIQSTAKRYRYTGKERDEESGLYYHGARYYMPWIGRWCSCDPLGVADGLNIYFFTTGNPVNQVDRTGTQSTPNEQPMVSTLRCHDAQPPPKDPKELTTIPPGAALPQNGWFGNKARDVILSNIHPAFLRHFKRGEPDVISSDSSFDDLVDKLDRKNARRAANFGEDLNFWLSRTLEVEEGLGSSIQIGTEMAATRASLPNKTRAATPSKISVVKPPPPIPDEVLVDRVKFLHRELVAADFAKKGKVLTAIELDQAVKQANSWGTVSIVEIQIENRVVRIVNTTSPSQYKALKSGNFLQANEILGSSPGSINWTLLKKRNAIHAEQLGVNDAITEFGAKGGRVASSNPGCPLCVSLLHQDLPPGFRHLNPAR